MRTTGEKLEPLVEVEQLTNNGCKTTGEKSELMMQIEQLTNDGEERLELLPQEEQMTDKAGQATAGRS